MNGAAAQCAGSRGGTDLGTFTQQGRDWIARCGVCGGNVPITIEGRAMPHQARTDPRQAVA